MRELTNQEVTAVSGGFAGTPIPFRNGFIPGANWPGAHLVFSAAFLWLGQPVVQSA